MAFRVDSTDTYTYASGSTGGTVDLGARNNYRYVNASNVYSKGKGDGVTTHTGTYTLKWDSDFGATKDMGVEHTYRYIKVPAKPFEIGIAELAYLASTGEGTFGRTVSVGPGYYLLIDWSFAASDATRTVTLSGGTNLLAKDAPGFGFVRIRIVKCTATSTNLTASVTCDGGNHRQYGYGIFRIVTGV